MKKTMVLVMALLLACGCMAVPAGLAVNVDELEQVELVYWIGGDGVQKDTAEVYALIDAELTEKLHATVKWENVPFGDYQSRWGMALAAQEQIDLCWTGWMINIQQEVANGALLPLDDYAEYGPDLFASLDEGAINMHRSSDGNLYQFPAWQGMLGKRSYYAVPSDKLALVEDDTWLSTFQDLLYENWNKTGEDKMVVYDHVEKYLEALKANDALAMGYPAGVNDLYGWYMEKSIYSFAADTYVYVNVNDDEFKVQSLVDSDYFKLNAQRMADWFQKGYVRSDIASLDVANGLIIDWSGTSTDNIYVMNGHNGFTPNSLAKELAGVGFPVDAVFTNPYATYINGAATGTSIPFTSKNPERAMMLMNLLVTEEGMNAYNLFSFGIEGKHYEWNDAHDSITIFGGTTQSASDWDYGARPWTLGSLMFAYSSNTYPADYYADMKAGEETAYVEPLSLCKIDVSGIETEAANLIAVYKEYDPMLKRGYLGADWEAKYDEFVAKMYEGGLQNVLDEYQRQVDAFVAANGSKW